MGQSNLSKKIGLRTWTGKDLWRKFQVTEGINEPEKCRKWLMGLAASFSDLKGVAPSRLEFKKLLLSLLEGCTFDEEAISFEEKIFRILLSSPEGISPQDRENLDDFGYEDLLIYPLTDNDIIKIGSFIRQEFQRTLEALETLIKINISNDSKDNESPSTEKKSMSLQSASKQHWSPLFMNNMSEQSSETKEEKKIQKSLQRSWFLGQTS